MKRATPDEATELSSARRGGATECGAAAKGGCHGGRRALPAAWFGARGQGCAFGGGLNVLSPVRGLDWANPTTNKTAESSISKVIKIGMRQPRCAPSPRAFASDQIFLGGLP
jgi:hypothetical protein